MIEEARKLADEIERSDGLYCMNDSFGNGLNTGGHQLGIKKSAMIVAALRSQPGTLEALEMARDYIEEDRKGYAPHSAAYAATSEIIRKIDAILALTPSHEAGTQSAEPTEQMYDDARLADRLMESYHATSDKVFWTASKRIGSFAEAGTQEPVAWRGELDKLITEAMGWHPSENGPSYSKARKSITDGLLALCAAPASHGAKREALVMAISHIEHMAYWIQKQQDGYSFEALGEDMPTMQAALLKETK